MKEDSRGETLRGARSVLGVVFLATFLMSLSSNMLNIAVPALTSHFGSSAGESTLVVVAYQLVNTALLIPAGQVADSLDRRVTFLGGLAFFALVSLLMGFSPSILGVAAGRSLQGAAAALLLSNAVAILASVFPPHRLAAAMGVYLSGFSLGQVLGPMVGGLIVSTVGWRWLFWVLVPVALSSFLWGMRALRVVPSGRAHRLQLDVPGGIVLAIILAGSQLALSLAAQVGFGDRRVLLALGACLALVPVLVLVERRLRHPVFAPELFRDRAFPLALLQGFLVMMPRLGAVTVAGLWFQGVAGDSAALSAVKIIGFPLGLTIGSLAGDRISRIWPPRAVVALSAAVATGGMGLLLADVRTGEDWVTVIGLGVMGLADVFFTLRLPFDSDEARALSTRIAEEIALAAYGASADLAAAHGVFQTLNSSLIMTSTPRGRTGVVNSIRVMVQAFGTGAGLALSMALIVAFATADQALLFLSGDAAALGAGRAAIDAGFAAAYGTFFVLMALGTAATLVRPRRRP